MAKRQHKRKQPDDPLVPIDGARVQAGLDMERWSVNSAAQRLRTAQQTLDSIVRGKTRRTHKSLRDSIAKLVGVPSPWLGGEVLRLLPQLPIPGMPPSPIGVDENFRPVAIDKTQRPDSNAPRYQLAAFRLLTAARTAWERDMQAGVEESTEAFTALGSGHWRGREWDRLAMVLQRVTSATAWRGYFFSATPYRPLGESDVADRVAVAAARALESVLDPWFRGLVP